MKLFLKQKFSLTGRVKYFFVSTGQDVRTVMICVLPVFIFYVR